MITQNDQQFMQRFAAEFMAPMAAAVTPGQVTPEGYRSAMSRLDPWKNETPVPDPELAAYHPAVELRPGLSAAIAVPKGDGPFPVFVIVHGNGLAAGSSHLYRRLTKDIAAGGYVAITPDFRLAPEHPFPAGYDDIVFTLSWAAEHAAEYAGDGSRMVLWGDSLGATLAMGPTLELAKKLNESGIPFQLHVLEGMPHDFMKFPELDGMREGHRLMFDYLSRSV